MALINDDEGVLGKVLHQGWRGLSGSPSAQMSGVVLYALTVTDVLEYLKVKVGASPQPFCLCLFSRSLQLFHPLFKLRFDGGYGPFQSHLRGDIVSSRVDLNLFKLLLNTTCEGVYYEEILYLISPELHPYRGVFHVRGIDLYHLSSHPECAPVEVVIVAGVLDLA